MVTTLCVITRMGVITVSVRRALHPEAQTSPPSQDNVKVRHTHCSSYTDDVKHHTATEFCILIGQKMFEISAGYYLY